MCTHTCIYIYIRIYIYMYNMYTICIQYVYNMYTYFWDHLRILLATWCSDVCHVRIQHPLMSRAHGCPMWTVHSWFMVPATRAKPMICKGFGTNLWPWRPVVNRTKRKSQRLSVNQGVVHRICDTLLLLVAIPSPNSSWLLRKGGGVELKASQHLAVGSGKWRLWWCTSASQLDFGTSGYGLMMDPIGSPRKFDSFADPRWAGTRIVMNKETVILMGSTWYCIWNISLCHRDPNLMIHQPFPVWMAI